MTYEEHDLLSEAEKAEYEEACYQSDCQEQYLNDTWENENRSKDRELGIGAIL